MGANIAYASKPFNGAVALTLANTNRVTPTNAVDIYGTGTTPGAIPATGVVLQRIEVQASDNPADCTVQIFLHNGTVYLLFDEFDLGDPAASSATLPGARFSKVYNDLPLQAGWKLAAAVSAAPTTGQVNVFAFGGDLT